MRIRSREGMTLVEVTAAFAITGLLLAILLGLLTAQARLARSAAQRVLSAEAVRTTAAVLNGEAHRAAATDVRAVHADSLAMRSFRGSAVVCSSDAARLVVRYRGDRLPDERKDSMLVIRDDGSSLAVALISVRSGACGAALTGEDVLELRTAPHAAAAGLVLVFESGSYYLTTRALRYRLGAEGRQPLTAEAFHDPSTAFLGAGATGIRYRLTVRPGPSAELFAGFPRSR